MLNDLNRKHNFAKKKLKDLLAQDSVYDMNKHRRNNYEPNKMRINQSVLHEREPLPWVAGMGLRHEGQVRATNLGETDANSLAGVRTYN